MLKKKYASSGDFSSAGGNLKIAYNPGTPTNGDMSHQHYQHSSRSHNLTAAILRERSTAAIAVSPREVQFGTLCQGVSYKFTLKVRNVTPLPERLRILVVPCCNSSSSGGAGDRDKDIHPLGNDISRQDLTISDKTGHLEHVLSVIGETSASSYSNGDDDGSAGGDSAGGSGGGSGSGSGGGDRHHSKAHHRTSGMDKQQHRDGRRGKLQVYYKPGQLATGMTSSVEVELITKEVGFFQQSITVICSNQHIVVVPVRATIIPRQAYIALRTELRLGHINDEEAAERHHYRTHPANIVDDHENECVQGGHYHCSPHSSHLSVHHHSDHHGWRSQHDHDYWRDGCRNHDSDDDESRHHDNNHQHLHHQQQHIQPAAHHRGHRLSGLGVKCVISSNSTPNISAPVAAAADTTTTATANNISAISITCRALVTTIPNRAHDDGISCSPPRPPPPLLLPPLSAQEEAEIRRCPGMTGVYWDRHLQQLCLDKEQLRHRVNPSVPLQTLIDELTRFQLDRQADLQAKGHVVIVVNKKNPPPSFQ